MKANEEIKIEAFEQDKGLYYVELPYGEFEVDGNRINISGSNNKVILELGKSVQIFKINKYTLVDKYVSSEDEISAEEYNKKVTGLRIEGYDDDTESWYNIDLEYEYKKFTQKYKPVYISTEVQQPFAFDIKYAVANLPKFIEPMRKLNGDLKSTIYIYNQNQHISQIVREFLLNIGYIEAKNEYTSENEFYIRPEGIRFSKIGKSRDFITIRMNLSKYEEKGTYKDTYDKVFDLYNRNIKEIMELLNIWHLKNIKVEITSYTDIINKLERFKNEVLGLEVKAKSSNGKQSLVRSIGLSIEDMKKQLLTNS